MMASRMARRTALVTGASSGIGFELARLLAAEGHDLVIVGRRRHGLEALAQAVAEHRVAVHLFESDLSVPDAAGKLWANVSQHGLAIDLLINNAGIGLHGPLADQPDDALTGMLELNVVALTMLTRLALPGMLARRWGRVLNVASVVAFQPGGPGMSAYYGSKAYVLSFSRGLAGELRGTGVSVTALCPGTSRTAFDEASGAARTRLYRWLPQTTPEAVARAGYGALMRGAGVSVPGLTAKTIAVAGGLPPRQLALEVNRFLLREA